MRDKLAALGLESFVKTTGGKGREDQAVWKDLRRLPAEQPREHVGRCLFDARSPWRADLASDRVGRDRTRPEEGAVHDRRRRRRPCTRSLGKGLAKPSPAPASHRTHALMATRLAGVIFETCSPLVAMSLLHSKLRRCRGRRRPTPCDFEMGPRHLAKHGSIFPREHVLSLSYR